MADKGSNNTWLIWVLFIVAGVVVVMAFSKEKPKSEAVAPVVASVASSAVALAPDVQTIKPAHTATTPVETAKPKQASSVVVPLQEVAQRNVLAVQVYSFKEKKRAELALTAIKDKGYSAYIMVSDLGARGIWYRVRVGTFSTEVDARKALERITKDFKSGIIVTE